MLKVNFHSTEFSSEPFKLEVTTSEGSTWDSKTYNYIVATLNEDVNLVLSPVNAEQLAKALLSAVQKLQEKEIENV